MKEQGGDMEERLGSRYYLMPVQRRMRVIDTQHQNWVDKMAQSDATQT